MGGDCEDLAILIADILVSSKCTKDWTIQYVYMDADNPTSANDLNHVILYVNDKLVDITLKQLEIQVGIIILMEFMVGILMFRYSIF